MSTTKHPQTPPQAADTSTDQGVVSVRCHAGDWKPTGRYEYTGKDCSRDFGGEFASLRPGVRGHGMDLRNRYGEIFFVPDGDDPATDGYYLMAKDGITLVESSR